MPPRPDQLVPSNDLADILVPILDRIESQHIMSTCNWQHGAGQDAGPFAAVYKEVADILGVDEYTVLRRLWSVRNRDRYGTGVTVADALLWACQVFHADLPIFPATCKGAADMIDAYHEDRGEELTAFERQRLGEYLLHFSVAYLRESADEKTQKIVENERVKSRNRSRQAVAA